MHFSSARFFVKVPYTDTRWRISKPLLCSVTITFGSSAPTRSVLTCCNIHTTLIDSAAIMSTRLRLLHNVRNLCVSYSSQLNRSKTSNALRNARHLATQVSTSSKSDSSSLAEGAKKETNAPFIKDLFLGRFDTVSVVFHMGQYLGIGIQWGLSTDIFSVCVYYVNFKIDHSSIIAHWC